MNRKVVVLLAVILAVPSIAAHRRTVTPPSLPSSIDAARSLVVTDLSILDGFPFLRLMNTIVAGSTTTGQQLIRQMFDTQNPKPGLADAAAPHCDDFLVDGAPAFNGFPRHCPTPDGKLAATPFDPYEYEPLALVNRFDMAPADGANCGVYRIAYFNQRTYGHLVADAVLPNPHRELGIAGCRPVAQFWADLSAIYSPAERGLRLERFFFEGIDGFEPVVRADHYTAAAGGGFRTRQLFYTPERRWSGFQFRLQQQCAAAGCTLRFVPDLLANMPFASLFDANVDTPAARAFREHFLTQIPTLAINDLNSYRMNIDRQFLLGESSPLDDLYSLGYASQFNQSQSTDAGKAFRAQIDAELKRIGSTLAPEDIVVRAETQSCNGCHFVPQSVGGGLIFPGTVDGAHISQTAKVAGDGGPNTRWLMSSAMESLFVPNRVRILREFLTSGKPPDHSN